jgi:hypothetical protein
LEIILNRNPTVPAEGGDRLVYYFRGLCVEKTGSMFTSPTIGNDGFAGRRVIA